MWRPLFVLPIVHCLSLMWERHSPWLALIMTRVLWAKDEECETWLSLRYWHTWWCSAHAIILTPSYKAGEPGWGGMDDLGKACFYLLMCLNFLMYVSVYVMCMWVQCLWRPELSPLELELQAFEAPDVASRIWTWIL